MNQEADNEPLLADVLAEGTPADFRSAMLGETLRRVCRRRRWRQTRRAAALLAALGLCGICVWQKDLLRQSMTPAPVAEGVAKNYQRVETQPLPAGAIVATQPLASGQLVAPAETVAMVPTSGGNYRVINDTELLALVAAHPAVLIRTGPHSEDLVFANPEDQKGFPLN